MARSYNPKALARALKVRRLMAEMSQNDLAEASGVSVASISKYESEATGPTFENVCKLAAALGCTPNDLGGFSKND